MAYNSKTGGDEMKEAAALPRGGRHKAPLRPLPAMDLPFLVLVLTLVGFGLVMLGSASGAVALYRRGDAFAYLRPQLLYAAMGIAGLWMASRVDYHIFHKLAWPLLGAKPSVSKLVAVGLGAVGVAMVVLKGGASLDLIGVLAALGGAFAVALGGGLIHKWGRPASIVSLAAWQMIIGGVELSVVALALGDIPTSLTGVNVLGLTIVALFLTALAFVLWFTAIEGAGPAAVAPLMLLTPLTAFVLDGLVRGVIPSPLQSVGVAVVIGSLLYGQHVDRRAFRVAQHHAPSARQLAQRAE